MTKRKKPDPPEAGGPTSPDDPYGDKAFLADRAKARRAGWLGDDTPVDPLIRAVVEGADDTPGKVVDLSSRFAAARRALLDVETPAETSEAAEAMSEAARRVRGFAWEPGPLGLPPNMPVQVLGKRGPHLYFMNPIDELVEVTAAKISQQGELDNLFAPDGGYLWGFYAQPSKQGELRIKYEDVRRDLIQASGRVAMREGVFDPAQKVRGRGAWKTADGVLVLHLGDRLIVGDEVRDLGDVEGLVYPREETLASPIGFARNWEDDDRDLVLIDEVCRRRGVSVGEARRPGQVLLDMLQTWHFRRGKAQGWLDARIELGGTVCGMMAAALDWRPQTFVIGDAGSGKSSLQELRKKVLGARLMDVVDPTAAGIYQTLGRGAIMVAVDEFEVEGDDASDSRTSQILKLARYSSSGARIPRGGQDGVPSNYDAKAVFAFSGINMPALKPAEASRMAIVAMTANPDDRARPPVLSAAEGAAIGRGLLARVVARWHEWPQVLAAWREVLLAGGQSSRAADQFGTLLAAAHMVCHDGVPLPSQVEDIAQHLGRATLAETASAKPNWERCIDWLMQAQPEAWRGNRHRSIGEYLAAYAEQRNPTGEAETPIQAAKRTLAQAGLGLVARVGGDLESHTWLAVPVSHAKIGELFRATQWGSRAGGAEGTWSGALQFAPADLAEARNAKLDGRATRCVQLRLDKLLAGGDAQEEPGENG